MLDIRACRTLPKPLCLHCVPKLFLILVELAGQGINRNIVQGAELAPQHKAQIVLSGGIGDGIIYGDGSFFGLLLSMVLLDLLK